MMNNKAKKLLKENNKFEKNLSKESNEVLTDIVAYLRGSALSEYHQEEVRRDISQMIFDGEKRNESIRAIIGEDYKSFCDEIVKSFPPRSKKEKFLEWLSLFFQMLNTLSLLWLFSSLILIFTENATVYRLPLSLDQIINGMFISIGSIFIVTFVSKTSFNKPIEVRKDKKFFGLMKKIGGKNAKK